MLIKTFDFVGESSYVDAVSDIREALSFLHDDDYAYDMAINEAVLNAAQNSVDGVDAAKIHIEMRITDYDVITKVSCETKPFDMLDYRKQLFAISTRPEFKGADWTDYTADTDASRGLWFMLCGTDYIYMDYLAQFVALCTRSPRLQEKTSRKMSDLLLRFFIEKDGVLI